MRRAALVCVGGLAIAGCAVDQRLTGPATGAGAAGSLMRVRYISRCGQGGGTSYRPFYEIDGQLYVPGDTAAITALDPARIAAIRVLKGAPAAARYGEVAGVAGIVIVTTRRAGGVRSRPAT